jgi:uncharacterized protein (DUF2141 family)
LSPSAAALGQSPLTSDIQIEIAGLRDAKGLVRLCLTRESKTFPDCTGPGTITASMKASMAPLHFTFKAVPAGTYAVAVFHDANGNDKLDTMFGIPKEGFAFSRNPAIHMRAPRFNEASFVTNGRPLASLKMKYLL